jgi:hypothetical protein
VCFESDSCSVHERRAGCRGGAAGQDALDAVQWPASVVPEILLLLLVGGDRMEATREARLTMFHGKGLCGAIAAMMSARCMFR